MASRIYDITLECGCMVSLDGGGGVMPCCYPEVMDKNNPKDKKQLEKCYKAWKKYKNSTEYEEHQKEIIERNR